MELNEIKNYIKKVKAPEMKSYSGGMSIQTIDNLITILKTEDAKDKKTLRLMKFAFGFLTIIYSIIFTMTWIFPPSGDPHLNRLSLALATIVFLSVLIYSVVKSRKLAIIDYSEPVLPFLKKTAERYRIINPKDLKFGIPYFILVFFMGAISWINGTKRYLTSLEEDTAVISYAVFFLIISLLGIFFTKKDWKKRKAPILEEINKMINSISLEEKNGIEENKI